MPRLPAVILAGGRATRMGGGDKVLLDLNAVSLLQHVIDRLRPQVGRLAISANGDPARFARFGLSVLPDSLPDYPGPLAGILAAMDWAAAEGAEAVVSVAGDTPFLPPDLISGLTGAAGPSGLVVAAEQKDDGALHMHPTFGLWPVGLRESLRDTLHRGQGRIRAFTDQLGARVAVFDGDGSAFFNINTPADLAHAATLHRMASK